VRVAILLAVLLVLLVGAWWMMICMPGKSARGPLPALTAHESEVRDVLKRDTQTLAGDIGERNLLFLDAYRKASDFMEQQLGDAGYAVKRETYMIGRDELRNVVAEIRGSAKPEEIVVIGAHYDSVQGTPGANDNGTGAVALLQLARTFANTKPARTLRFVAFANEEPPYFQTDEMGSEVYAKGCKAKHENVVAMISLETMGYFSDAPKSQRYPFPFNLLYPSTGNFIAFVGNVGSRKLVKRSLGAFRKSATIPSEGAAVPDRIPGIGWSDQWAFWRISTPALMVTDTAPFRYPHYHEPTDTPDKVDYDRLARVVVGLEPVVRTLSGE
jgi:hypothetical protein